MANGQDWDEALKKRIEAYNKKPNGKLDLSWIGLERLPEGFARQLKGQSPKEVVLTGNYIGEDGAQAIAREFSGLTALYISGNRIGDKGAKSLAYYLRSLTILDIGYNRISDEGANEIAKLSNLKMLKIEHNKIADLGAQALAKGLKNLVSLKAEHNSIADIGAEAIATHLVKLETLRIANNSIGDEGAEAIAENLPKLTKLTTLKIGNNRIGNDGARAILDALGQSSNRIHTLTLRGNLISFMPREVLGGSNAKALLAAYGRYEQARQSGELIPLNDAKIFIAGDDAIGKATLLELLVNKSQQPAPKQDNPQKTAKSIAKTQWTLGSSGIAVDILDFAEQEAAFAAHRYFLTERSLYIVVLSAHKRHDRSIYRWLSLIKARAKNAPVIVVINRLDDAQQHLTLQWDEIERAYPNDIARSYTSCEQRISDHYNSINELRELIAKTLENSPALKTISDKFPASWVRVKKCIAEKVKKKFVLTYNEFVSECKNTGSTPPPGDAIDNPDEQRQLLRTLHNLGVVIVPGITENNFGHPQNLRLLDPDCLAQGVDSILNNPKLLSKNGTFNELELIDCLSGTKYPQQHHDKIINFMLDESIGLAVRWGAHNNYLVPQALPAKNIDHRSNFNDDCLSFAYLYKSLPDYLLPYFIAKAFACLGKLKLGKLEEHTRYSAILSVNGCPTHVAVNFERNMLAIHVSGNVTKRPGVLEFLRNILSEEHERFGLEPKEHVPLPHDPDTLAPYEYLRFLHTRNADLPKEEKKYVFWPPNRKKHYEVKELLAGIMDDRPLNWPSTKSRTTANSNNVSPLPPQTQSNPKNPPPPGGSPSPRPTPVMFVVIGIVIGACITAAGLAIRAFAGQ